MDDADMAARRVRRRSLEADLRRTKREAILRHGPAKVEQATAAHLRGAHDQDPNRYEGSCYLCHAPLLRQRRNLKVAKARLIERGTQDPSP